MMPKVLRVIPDRIEGAAGTVYLAWSPADSKILLRFEERPRRLSVLPGFSTWLEGYHSESSVEAHRDTGLAIVRTMMRAMIDVREHELRMSMALARANSA